ncbi:hypothetical protein AcW1_002643 [Taiwanofungus camphoratus]|nr:hypothetical protein AcV5_009676 [Antrodia cinnamomea]KAI0942871.1 hypothetical protein AcV7_002166 [Antrodia cinnamomea]KAI0943492.1 hypothetical protein AcW1_002643 [Antrodia cinnamomea]
MVSADNLNLDCLELIFAYLHGNDLVSVSLVSRSFLAGVIPRLYRALFFKLNQAKRYPAIMSPFASVLAHPGLAVHVRHIDIRTVPTVKTSLHPEFMRDCSLTIETCKNLTTFTCTPNVLPSFLSVLQWKESLLHIRVNASLTTDQADKLVQIRGLRSVTLDTGTSNVVDALPKWIASLRSTLTTLTLYSMHDLNDCILESILRDLPNLTGLHIIGCSKVDHSTVLRLTAHTPLLESLSLTSWESPRPLPSYVSPLPRLRHLTVDTHCTFSPSATPSLWTSLVTLTRSWSCPLTSITLKLSEKLLVGDAFIKDVLDAHGATLMHLAFLNCALSLDSVRLICKRCKELERFAVSIPTKSIHAFAQALTMSKSLHTIVDVGDHHGPHGPKVYLQKSEIRTIMELVPNLKKVVTEGRVWTAQKPVAWIDDGFELQIERKKTLPAHWFIPPPGL